MQWNGSGASRVRRSSSASGRSTSTHLRLDDQGRTRQGRPTQSSRILRNPFHHVVIISQQNLSIQRFKNSSPFIQTQISLTFSF